MGGFTDLAGKTAVITGGASGIGYGIASALAAENVNVMIADVDQQALDEACATLNVAGFRTDVRDPASVAALADAVMARFGGIHLVFNNAGVGPFAAIADMQLDDWQWMLEVNLWGVIHGVRTFLPLLARNPDGGHLVNTASMGGFAVVPGLGAYAVTKAGIIALTETLSQELAAAGSKIGVSVLCPGTVHTNIQHSTRHRPADLAAGSLHDVDLAAEGDDRMTWLTPDDVGRIVVDGVRAGDLYILTHPAAWPRVQQRFERIESAFAQAQHDRLTTSTSAIPLTSSSQDEP